MSATLARVCTLVHISCKVVHPYEMLKQIPVHETHTNNIFYTFTRTKRLGTIFIFTILLI